FSNFDFLAFLAIKMARSLQDEALISDFQRKQLGKAALYILAPVIRFFENPNLGGMLEDAAFKALDQKTYARSITDWQLLRSEMLNESEKEEQKVKESREVLRNVVSQVCKIAKQDITVMGRRKSLLSFCGKRMQKRSITGMYAFTSVLPAGNYAKAIKTH